MNGVEEVVIDIIANDKASSVLENIRGKLIEINNLSSRYASAISNINPKINTPNIANPKVDTGSASGGKTKVDPSQTKLSDFTVSPRIDTKKIPREIQSRLDSFKPTVTPKVNTPKVDTTPIDSVVAKTNEASRSINQAMNSGTSSVKNFEKSTSDASKSAAEFGKDTSNSLKMGVSAFHEMNNLMVTVGGQFTNLSNQIAGLFGAAGLSGMIEKMWKGAAERQTNMLYLIHQKGTAQANAYYNEIMDIVARLPGDDTFLTNILNLSAAMDKDIKVDKLKELGTAITDYYIASTMKGEIPFEVERDMRKYMTTGETRPLRNSLLANEIDMLKNKNTVLERGEALQKALEKNGFAGMSQYESATNELEELRGHFQKAFADIGGAITSVVQPIMKLYNTLDSVFGSRISQGIILLATAFVGLFAAVGLTMVIIPTIIRNFEIVGMQFRLMGWMLDSNVLAHGKLNAAITMLIGAENAEAIAIEGNVVAGMKQIYTTYNQMIAKKLNIAVTGEETVSIWALTTASLSLMKTKIIEIAIALKNIIVGHSETEVELQKTVIKYNELGVSIAAADVKEAEMILAQQSIHLKIRETLTTIKETISVIANTAARTPNIISRWMKNEATLAETIADEINTLSENKNTSATIMNALSKIGKIINTIELVASTFILIMVEWLNTESTLAEASAHGIDAAAKMVGADATLFLAGATTILDIALAPITITILLIVAAIAALIIVVEKVGEAFGWWKDFGSMFQAIGDGINRIWNAFKNSTIIQGIISYFQKFVASIQYVFESISKLFGAIFGWNDDGGTFDIVQSIINIFGKLGDIVMWVWNIMDDWSNSPLGIITWLNPLGILIFHLDEIGSLFEDIGDAINRFMETSEFNELVNAWNEAMSELQAPFQEIGELVGEIISIFSELFNSEDPEGQGTEGRINFLVEILKGLALIIRAVVIPAIRGIAMVIRIVLTPIRVVLMIIRGIIGAIQWATQLLGSFTNAWQILISPLTFVQNLLSGISNMVNQVSDAIKNSIIGKLLGWDKDNKDNEDVDSQVKSSKNRLYDSMKKTVSGSNLDFVTKNQILGELDKQNLTNNNVNNVRNLGRTYNNHNNQRQVVINQNFSEGAMPIDARNMTKKEARKMFIGAFGYRRAVGSNNAILR